MFIKVARVRNEGLKPSKRKTKAGEIVEVGGERFEKESVLELADRNGEPYSWVKVNTIRAQIQNKKYTLLDYGGFDDWLKSRKDPKETRVEEIREVLDFLKRTLEGHKELAALKAENEKLKKESKAKQ